MSISRTEDGVYVDIQGMEDVLREFRALPDRMRRRVLLSALRAAARPVRDDARRATPVMSLQDALQAPYRKRGTVRKAITIRTSRQARRRKEVGVFVNVRPLPRGQRGAKNPNDPFYWRWLNFGKRGYAGAGFLEQGAARLRDALEIFKREAGPRLQKLNTPSKGSRT